MPNLEITKAAARLKAALNDTFEPAADTRIAARVGSGLVSIRGAFAPGNIEAAAEVVVNVGRPSAALYAAANGSTVVIGGGSGGGTSTTVPAGVSLSDVNSAIATAITNHANLDFVVGHHTGNALTNMHDTYYSWDWGVRGGTGVDESINIQTMLFQVGYVGGGVCVISATNYADNVIEIEKTVSIYHDNVHVVFDPATRVSAGAQQCLRIMGSLDEYTRKIDGTAIKLHIASTVNGSNQTVLEMSATDTALMDAEAVPANRIVVVGDKIVVRGQNDVTGKAIEKDTTFVASLAKVGSYWRITCVDELDYTFQPTYPSSDWIPDHTTGTTIYIVRFGTISSDLAAGSVSAVVNSVTGFNVGDVIQVGDSRTENAYNASALKSDGTPYANPAALELLRIISINTSTNTIGFDRATVRTYKAGSPYYGGVARTVMVRNSSISGARITYHALQTSTSFNALQMTYAVECEIHHCMVDGLVTQIVSNVSVPLYGRAAHALRMSYALNCKAYDNVILDCADSTSGRGYGITDYYSTGNEIFDNVISGCRHNILLQLATNSIIHGNESRNHLISGIDVHGVNSYGFHIYGNTITQANGSTTDSTQGAGVRVGNTSHSDGDHFGVVENNLFIYNSGTSDQAMDVIANSSNITFRNNTVENANIGWKFTLNSKQITPVQTATNILLEGNRFIGCTAGCISVTAAPTYDNVNSNGKLDKFFLVDNISDGNDKHFQMTGVVTTLGLSNVIVIGNKVINPTNVTTTNYGVNVKYTSGYVHIYDNDVSGAQRGITALGCGTVYVVGNKTASTIQTDPFTDGGGNTFLSYIDAMSTGGGGGSSAFATNVSVTNAAPEYIWVESGFTTDNTTWDIVVDAGIMHYRMVNDAFSAAADWMTVTRSANVATALNMAANMINLSGTLTVNSAAPDVYWIETGHTANNTTWDTVVDSGIMHFRLLNDALSSSADWMTVTRSANTATVIALAATALNLTGALSVTGAATVDGVVYARQPGGTNFYAAIYAAGGVAGFNGYNTTLGQSIPIFLDGMTVTIRTGATLTNQHVFDQLGNVTIAGAAQQGTMTIARGTTSNDGTLVLKGTTHTSHFNYSTTEDIYIRGGKTGSNIFLNDSHNGAVDIASGGGATTVRGDFHAVGATSSTALGVDNVRAGVNTGIPVIYFEDASSTVRGIDNSAGTLRFTHPGVVDMTIDTSSNVTATGNFITDNKFVSNVSSPSGKIHVEDFGIGYLLAMGTAVSTTPIDVSGNIVDRGVYVVGTVWAVSGVAGAIVHSTLIAPSGNYDIVVGAYTFRISLTSGGKIQVVSQAGGSNWDFTLGFYYL